MNLRVARWQRRGASIALLGICWFAIWALAGMAVGLDHLADLPLIQSQGEFAWMLVSGNFFFFAAGVVLVAAGIEEKRIGTTF